MRSHILTAFIALLFGFGGAAVWSFSGLGDNQTRSYLLANPELLPQMANELQRRDGEQRLAAVASEVTAPFPGAVLGNPNGSKTLVEFTDYGCTYCRQSTADVAAMIEADPELRVVIREFPIFQGSDVAARMALAAAQQGKYAAFHEAMFDLGPPSASNVERAAQQAGLDLAEAQEFAASPEASAELAKNMAIAQQLGFEGTPSWVVGDQLLEGAVGQAALTNALKGA